TALVGESGSGKSTVARLLSRLYAPTTGTISFRGEDVSRVRGRRALLAYRSEVQMIFQDPFASLNPVKRVQHHIERPLRIHGLAPKRPIDARDRHPLETMRPVPTGAIEQKYPRQLTG